MGGVGRPISKGEPRNFIQKALNFPAQPRNFIQTTSYAKRWQPRSCDSQYHFIIDNRFLLNFTKCSLFWLQHNSHFPHFGETGCPFPLDGAALCFLPSLWPHEAILPAPDFLLQVPLPIHPIALSPSQPLILQLSYPDWRDGQFVMVFSLHFQIEIVCLQMVVFSLVKTTISDWPYLLLRIFVVDSEKGIFYWKGVWGGIWLFSSTWGYAVHARWGLFSAWEGRAQLRKLPGEKDWKSFHLGFLHCQPVAYFPTTPHKCFPGNKQTKP